MQKALFIALLWILLRSCGSPVETWKYSWHSAIRSHCYTSQVSIHVDQVAGVDVD